MLAAESRGACRACARAERSRTANNVGTASAALRGGEVGGVEGAGGCG